MLYNILLLGGCFLFIGIMYEKITNPKITVANATQLLKRDIASIFYALFHEEKTRCAFDNYLADTLRVIVKPYSAIGMDIDVVQDISNGLPFIGVRFVPKTKLELEEIETISEHLQIKFRRYLYARSFNWRTVTCFSCGVEFVTIQMFYEEFPEDKLPFEQLFKRIISESIELDYGYLKDEQLEQELNEIC